MEREKKEMFSAFTRKAMERLREKKTRKYRILSIPSIGQNIRIRNLDYNEIIECMKTDDSVDPNRSDKYAVYLAVTEPDLKMTAKELKEAGEIMEYMEAVEIFDMSEIQEIATEIMKLSGYISGKKVAVVEELKN